MDMTCLDLSPFYLAKARENLQYWRSKRALGAVNTDEFIQVVPMCRLHLSSLSRNRCSVRLLVWGSRYELVSYSAT